MANTTLSLSPDLILGLLGELPGILQDRESPMVGAFYDLLYAHPVARSTRERSLAPTGSTAPLSTPLPTTSSPLSSETLPDSMESLGMTVHSPTVVQSATAEESRLASDKLATAFDQDVDQIDALGMDGEECSENVGGKNCCRNGSKRVTLRRGKRGNMGKRDIQDVDKDESGMGDGPFKRLRSTQKNILDAGEGEHQYIEEMKGEKGRAVKSASVWMTNGTPPPIETRTGELIDMLSCLDLNEGVQSLIILAQRLVLPVRDSEPEHPAYSLVAVVADCKKRESNVVLEDFLHMISLMRLAFYLEREMRLGAKIVDIANRPEINIPHKTLWNWLEHGTRLIHLCSGGTFYMILVLACLKLKTAFLSRDATVNYIIEALAFVLRVPERANISEAHLFKVQNIIIPQICRIRNCAPLRSILSFIIFPESDTSPGMSLDFFDVNSTDKITDAFRTNVFILPQRSPLWSSVLTSSPPMGSIDSITPPHSIVSKYQKAVRINLPFSLANQPDSPYVVKTRKAWTEAERIKAGKASVPRSMAEFNRTLLNMQEDGVRKLGKYVKFPQNLLKGKNHHVRDLSDDLVALIISSGSDLLQQRIQRLSQILKDMDSSFMESSDSKKKGYKFDTIYADTYNRYAQKGYNAPPDVHPHFIYKKGATKTNHEQRRPYLAAALKKNPKEFEEMDSIISDIIELLCSTMIQEVPGSYETLQIFCELLPLNHRPHTFPFPGWVLNINVCTDGHKDTNDAEICVVIPGGPFRGGELVLHEAGLVLELVEGDILVFPSWKITHFNLHFEGSRLSIVLHSDKEVSSWNKDRNGWSGHIVV